MDYNKYLHEHHHITSSAIGLARMALENGEPDKAKQHLDKACDELSRIHGLRLDALAQEKGLDREALRAIFHE